VTELATAVAWLWLGMVLAISFLEAPLKFRAPGVDLRTGLAIGRVVFRALNTVEALLAVLLVAALLLGDQGRAAAVAGGVVVVALVVQLVAVRPALTRRSDAVLSGAAGEDGPRSHAHLWYVGLETVKVAGLVVAGVALL
jgi:hypothetical protein